MAKILLRIWSNSNLNSACWEVPHLSRPPDTDLSEIRYFKLNLSEVAGQLEDPRAGDCTVTWRGSSLICYYGVMREPSSLGAA